MRQGMLLRGVTGLSMPQLNCHPGTKPQGKLTSMTSTTELAKLTLRILGRGIPTSRCSVKKKKMVENKDGVSQTQMMDGHFSLLETQLLVSKFLLTPPYTPKDKSPLFYIMFVVPLQPHHLEGINPCIPCHLWSGHWLV